MDVHAIAGFLRGLIEAQKEEEAKAEREREQGRQEMLLQMQLSEMLFRRQMIEKEQQREAEKLQLMKEAHEWGRQKHEMELRQNTLALHQQEASHRPESHRWSHGWEITRADSPRANGAVGAAGHTRRGADTCEF